ncbi:MAG: hypothetical protein AAB676_11200 [Verrucomicrobiota bacterium]
MKCSLKILFFLNLLPAAILFAQDETVPGLRPYEQAQFYVRISADEVAILTGAQIDGLRRDAEDVRVLKRKYSLEEFAALAHAKATKSSQTLANEFLRMRLSDDGNFQMQQTTDGRYLIYPGFTSAFSIKVDNHKYCNRSTDRESPTILTVAQPLTVNGTVASIQYSTAENVDIIQRFILEGKACRFEVEARNRDSVSHNVQVRYQFDTQIHENDGAPLYAQPVGTRVKETEVAPLTFSQWQSWLDPVQDPGDLYGIGTIIAVPTRVVFAWWPEASDSAWDYTPNPNQLFYTEGYVSSPKSDSCVLYYMTLGVIAPSASSTVSSAYGAGTAQANSRNRLVEALRGLADAIKGYQNACAIVGGDAFAKTAITARRDENLKDVAQDLAIDLLADGTMSRTAGKLFSKGVSDQFTRWLVKNIAKKAAIKGFSIGEKALVTWIKAPEVGGIDPEWDRDDPNYSRTSDYIKNFILTTLSAELAETDTILVETVAGIPDPLPEGYPLDETIAMLQHLRNEVLRLTPTIGRETEDVVHWAIPGLLDDETFGDYNPVLLGASSKVASGHKLYVTKLILGGLENIKLLRRVGCIGWQVGLGVVKIVAHVGSAATTGPGAVPLAAPIEGLFWGGVGVCSTAGLANSGIDVIGKNYAVFQLAVDIESIQSDIELALATFNAVADSVVAAQTLEGSLRMTVTDLEVDDLEVGWLDLFGNGQAMLRVANNDTTHAGYCRVFATISRKNILSGAYDDIVSTSTAGFQVQPSARLSIALPYEVPVGILLSDRYLVECNVITSSGYNYRSAFFRACNPAACWIDDQITRIGSGTLAQGQRASGNVTGAAAGGSTELSLNYPGSDFDLHVYDSQGRHVGMNYAVGNVEVGIPGASYSGPQSKPEVIRIPPASALGLRYEVIAVEASGSQDFEVFAAQETVRNATLVSMPRAIELDAQPGVNVTGLRLLEVGGQNEAALSAVTCSQLAGEHGTIEAESVAFVNVPERILPSSDASLGMTVTVGPSVPSGVYTGIVSITWNAGRLEIPVSASVLSQALLQEVTTNATTTFNSWTLDRASGALVATITITNSSGKSGLPGVPLEKVFWYAITESTNIRLATVTGQTNGMAYYDVTAQVEAQLPSVGNGDMRLDIGESVSFTVPIYTRDRSRPVGHVFGIWADPPFGGSVASSSEVPRLEVSRAAEGSIGLSWPATKSQFVLEEADSIGSSWREVSTPPVISGNKNTVTILVGSGTKFYRLRKN